MKNRFGYTITIIIFISFFLNGWSQSFFVTSPINSPVGNHLFELNITGCDSLEIYACPPINNIIQYPENQYSDIDIDSNQNIYLVSSWGSLYKRNLNDTACQFLGTFNHSINSLVSNLQGEIFAAGTQSGLCTLFKYDITTGLFDTLGNFPDGFFSAGDMFFYEKKLFLTATNSALTSSFLIEVNLSNPSQSCYYMDLLNLQPYGAFSIKDSIDSKAYLITTNNSLSSSLVEIDIETMTVGSILCTYPFLIGGAARWYELTSINTSTNCPSNLSMDQEDFVPFSVQNPVTDFIVINFNISQSDINEINVLNLWGVKLKSFTPNNIHNIEVSDLTLGVYIIQVVTAKNHIYSQRFVKTVN